MTETQAATHPLDERHADPGEGGRASDAVQRVFRPVVRKQAFQPCEHCKLDGVVYAVADCRTCHALVQPAEAVLLNGFTSRRHHRLVPVRLHLHEHLQRVKWMAHAANGEASHGASDQVGDHHVGSLRHTATVCWPN